MAKKQYIAIISLTFLYTCGTVKAEDNFFTHLKKTFHAKMQAHHCPKPRYSPFLYTFPTVERIRQCCSKSIPFAYSDDAAKSRLSVRTHRYKCPQVAPAGMADVYLRSAEPNQYPAALPMIRGSAAPK